MTPTKFLGLLLVIVYVVALKVLSVLDIGSIFEHRLLLPILNTLFAGMIPIAIALIAGRTYSKSGSSTVLFMGCGMLSFGLCAISAGWLIRASDGANLNVTVYNTGAFLGSLFHAIGAVLSLVGMGYPEEIGKRRREVILAYLGILMFVICFSLIALKGWVPPFFIQGVGPTELRQAILGSAVLLYVVSSIFLMAHYFRRKTDFLYWYSLCLAMLAIGLFAFFVQKSVGSPVGWLGRSANYFGGIFALGAILAALRKARGKGAQLEQSIADLFQDQDPGYRYGFLAALPIPVLLILMVIVVSLDIRTVFEPPGLYAALNTLFLSILPLTVVYFATRGFLESGFFTMLMLGAGTLALGLGSLSSGWIMTLEGGGPNAGATIFNVSLLLSGIFQLLGGLLVLIGVHPDKGRTRDNLIATFTYVGVTVLLAFLTSMTLQNRIPVFFIQGEGPTALRQVILATATLLFGISGLLLMITYLFSRARILYWYSLALFLLGTGAISLMAAKSVGSPIAWLGRSSMYLSGIYLFVAVTIAATDLRARGESLETGVANFFRHRLEWLVEERTLQLSHAKEELQAAHNELERVNSELGLRVKERTAELELANEKLILEIQHRERAEASVTAERQRLYDILDTMPEMVCLLTPDHHYAFVNRSFREKFGEDDGRHCFDRVFGKKEPCEFCEAYTVLKTGEPHHWEVEVSDGSIIDVYNFPFVDVDGSPLILEIDIDITEQRRTEEALRAAGAYNRSLIEASLDPLVTISAEGKITDVNSATERVTGHSREELIGTDFADYFSDPAKARFGYKQVFQKNFVKNYELGIQHKNGWLTPVMYNASLYRDDSGKIIGVFAAARDISDRKRVEEELTRSNQDLQQFAYVASHDLQEPLRNVASCLQLLEKEYKNKLDADADQYIKYAVEGSVRMKALIQDLLAYSRITTKGKAPEPVECEQVLDQTEKNLALTIAETGAVITHDPLPIIYGDDTQLLQVFQNLVGNAIKFRRDESPTVHVSAAKNTNEWVFAVKDNGIGIESRHLDRIFVIFQRLHKRSEYQGTGMGLAIVKKVIERHGGRVWVESEPGLGTTFFFTLPEKGLQI